MDVQKILEDELKGSIDFFLDFTNLQPGSEGFGLTVDSSKNRQMASVASVGYALTGWVIAAERGFVSKKRARTFTQKTLFTLLHHASHFRGFFAHFLDMETAQRWDHCEYSTIDTAICLNGVITAANYFHDPQIEEMARALLDRVDWPFIIFERNGRTLFRMSYNPDQDGAYVTGEPGFISAWDRASEQKMMYLQAALEVDPVTARKLYGGFSRDTGTYEGHKIIINPLGSLYAYLCSEAWLDAGRYLDPDGVDWFENLRLAALANRGFCLEHAGRYRTYHANSWGLSSGDSPSGYAVFGGTPCLGRPRHNGTVSIWSAVACLPAIPEQVLGMIEYLVQEQPQTRGRYGFFSAYNLDVTPPWSSNAVYGIEKGCSMIMVENYLTRLVWDTYTGSPDIQRALAVLGFTAR